MYPRQYDCASARGLLHAVHHWKFSILWGETVRCCLCRMFLIKAWRRGKDWRANMTQRQCEHNCARSVLPLKMQVITVKNLDSEWNFISNRFISQIFISSGTYCCDFFQQKHIGFYWLWSLCACLYFSEVTQNLHSLNIRSWNAMYGERREELLLSSSLLDTNSALLKSILVCLCILLIQSLLSWHCCPGSSLLRHECAEDKQ